MSEWLREGIEGRSLTATLRLYLLGLMVLAPAAAVLALAFGGQTAFVATPLLVVILVAVEYAVPYLAMLRKGFGELLWMIRPLIETKGPRGLSMSVRRVLSPDSVNAGIHVGASVDLPKEEKTLEALVHLALYDDDATVRADAAAALGAIGDGRAVDRLINALQDKDAKVRYRVAVTLMEIGDLRAVEPLVSALADEDASVRLHAAKALWLMSRLPTAQAVIAPEVIETISRMVNKSDGKRLKNEDVPTSTESVRKRA